MLPIPCTRPNPEQQAALLWYNSLSFQQQDFLSTYYNTPVSSSEYTILQAYKDRENTHKHRDWPASVFRSI